MAQLSSIAQYLDSLLQTKSYQDHSLNGIQVEASGNAVKRVAFAVDAGMSIVQKAIAAEAQLLVVHHGILWGTPLPISGAFGRKVEQLLRHGCSLYASHLPLDGHPEVGNAFELGRFLGLEKLEGFCPLGGMMIGARGTLRTPLALDAVAQKLAVLSPKAPLTLPFGKRDIRRVGIVTGSGSSALPLVASEGLDLLVSGEAKQESYHLAKDLEVSAIFAGHYATETFGVRALERRLKKDFDIQTLFIDEDTGI